MVRKSSRKKTKSSHLHTRFKDTQRKMTLKSNFSTCGKYENVHLGNWYIKPTLYNRSLHRCWVGFVLPILFVLTMTFNRAVLYGNYAISILVLSTKNRHSSFFKKVLVFQKICYKNTTLKNSKFPVIVA